MATSPVSTTPTLYSFLGDQVAESFVRRVFMSHGLDMKNSAEFYDALLDSTSRKVDNFILERLEPLDIEKLYVLKATNAPQNLITNYLNVQIPDFNPQLIAFFDQLFETVSKKLN